MTEEGFKTPTKPVFDLPLQDSTNEDDDMYQQIDSPKLGGSPKQRKKSYSLVDQDTESIPNFKEKGQNAQIKVPQINMSENKKSRRFSIFGKKEEKTETTSSGLTTKSPRFSIFSPTTKKSPRSVTPEISPRFQKDKQPQISPRFSLKNMFSPRTAKPPQTPRGYEESASFTISSSKLSGLNLLETKVNTLGSPKYGGEGFSSFLDLPVGAEQLGEDFDHLSADEKFLKIKEYRLETFETIQGSNLKDKNPLEEEHISEGCLYTEGLEFYFWVKAGGHLVHVFREKKKPMIDLKYQIFEENERKKTIWEHSGQLGETFEPDTKFIEAIGRSVETLFLLKITLNFTKEVSQETMFFGHKVDVKTEREREQRIQIQIKQTHEVAFSQWISLWDHREEIKIVHLLSDVGLNSF
jgi:hypothetical protein